MKITANGISMNYTLDGPAGAPVVTLSHSLATTLAMWEPQLKALTARCRVLNYDTRGHAVMLSLEWHVADAFELIVNRRAS